MYPDLPEAGVQWLCNANLQVCVAVTIRFK